MPRPRRQHAPQFERPRPFQVTRWGKFWSLEPLFEDERAWLMAQGGPPVNLGDVVLAVPAHGNRLRVTEVLGPSNDLRVVLTAMLHSHQVSHGFPEEVEEAARAVQGCAAAEDEGRVDLAGLHHRPRHGARLRRRHQRLPRGRRLPRLGPHRRRQLLRRHG
jgi:hypothetical protein